MLPRSNLTSNTCDNSNASTSRLGWHLPCWPSWFRWICHHAALIVFGFWTAKELRHSVMVVSEYRTALEVLQDESSPLQWMNRTIGDEQKELRQYEQQAHATNLELAKVQQHHSATTVPATQQDHALVPTGTMQQQVPQPLAHQQQQRRPHPHAGAYFANGTAGYIADVTAVRQAIWVQYTQQLHHVWWMQKQQQQQQQKQGERRPSVVANETTTISLLRPRWNYLPLYLDEDDTTCNIPLGEGVEGPHGMKVYDRVRVRHEYYDANILPQYDKYHHKQHLEVHRQKLGNDHVDDTIPTRNHSRRILCVVYTHGAVHDKRLAGIRDTWAWRCQGFMAASTRSGPANTSAILQNMTTITTMFRDKKQPSSSWKISLLPLDLGAVHLPHYGPEEYGNMWQKTRSIMGYLHDHYLNDFDYFYICGDDTHLIVENLHAYLTEWEQQHGPHHYKQPLYAGHVVSVNTTRVPFTIYVGGGSGYILNRMTLRRFVHESMDERSCRDYVRISAEDRILSMCLNEIGIAPTDTADSDHRARFHGLNAEWIAHRGNRPDLIHFRQVYGDDHIAFEDNVSQDSVSFHLFKTNAAMRRHHAILYRSCPRGTILGDALAARYPSEIVTSTPVSK